MGPNVATCWECNQNVDLTTFINALSKHNITDAGIVAIKYFNNKLTNTDLARLNLKIRHNSIVPFGYCKVCWQYKY